MNRDTFFMIALAALFVAAFVAIEGMSAEQTITNALSPAIATAVIPFDFWIGDSQLPAGDYGVYSVLGLASVLVLRNAKNGAQEQAFLIPMEEAVPPGDYELIFVTRNGENYLHEIWKPEGRGILTSEFAIGDAPGDTRSEVPLSVQGTPNSSAAPK